MLALFLLMGIPMGGWYFMAHLATPELLDSLPAEGQQAVLEAQHQVRLRLAATLGLSIVVLGAVIAWLRRAILDPLESLAHRARQADHAPWSAPPQLELGDEVGDLARALDRSVRRLQRRADEAERFAANLSHELRTPLTAIRGAAEILSDCGLSDADRSKFTAHVLREAERLERLVNGLLEQARADLGNGDERRQAIALGPIAGEVIESFQPVAEATAHRLELTVQPTLPEVLADPDAVRRVLTALVENATRFCPAGSSIHIHAVASDDHVEVRVDDAGPGVPDELRERVFDRCFSTHPVGTRTGDGTGLGLAIARGLVEAWQGRLWVDQSADGGASFRFTVPLATTDRPSVA
jgi:signal transduction histidine kinase